MLRDYSSRKFQSVSSARQDTGTVLHPPVLFTFAIHLDAKGWYFCLYKSRGSPPREDWLAGWLPCCLRYLAFRSQLPNHRERQPVSHGIETAELLTEQPGKHWDHLEEKRALVRHKLSAWTSFPDQLVKRKCVKLSASCSLWQEWLRHSSGMHHPCQSCITWQCAGMEWGSKPNPLKWEDFRHG